MARPSSPGLHIEAGSADVAGVQSVVTDRPAPRAQEVPSGVLTRLWGASIVWHALALFAVLLVAMLLTMPGQLGHADEGVAHAQAQLLADGEGWSTPHPLPAADPEGHAFPIGGSVQRQGTDDYVPFSKHPVYPLMLTPFIAAFGVAGGPLLSVLGGVAAAVATALIARRLDPSLARPALWFFGLATPMWFDSFITIAHTLGAAAIGFAVLLLLRPDFRGRHIAGGSALLMLAVLLRNEAVLLGVALAGVLAICALVRGERRLLVAGGGAFVATVAGYLLDARLVSWTLGGDAVEPFSIDHSGSFLAERIDGFLFTVLAPSDRTPTGLLLSTLCLVLVMGAAVVVRRHPTDGNGIVVFLGGAVVAAGLRWFAEPDAHIPGLLFAAPLLVGAFALLDRTTVVRRDVAILIATATLFAAGVVATQYSNGGGGGWGGRYFAIALPLVVPVALLAVRRAGERVPAATRPVAVGMCLALAAVLVVGQSTSLLVDHRLNRSFEEAIVDATWRLEAGDGDARPVVVSTRRGLGRMAFDTVLEQRWLEVPSQDEDVVPYIERLHAMGIERFVLITADLDETLPRIDSHYAVVRSLSVTATDPLGRSHSFSSQLFVLESVD